ncbi:recombinase RecT [Fusobacterium sp. HC1336]|uniref:recombinase RecT n=1 Tax=Fusobacterium sp. HC1336 TaxID=3171169 RepID=UPI003F209B5F
MAEVKKATNSLAKGTTGSVVEKKKGKTIFDIIKAGEQQFAAALPKHINSERFTRIAITTIRQNPKLAECNAESLLGSLMTIAQLGLEPGVLGQCYLIPFKNNKLGTIECQFQLGYKGMIELLRRTGQLSDIYAYTVYSNDEFSIEYGLERTLKHIPAFSNVDGRGEIVGFYSVAILKDGTRAFEYMTKREVIEHEEKYRKGNFKNDIWNKNFEEMSLKTVTKKMLKWLPISVEMIENLRKDEQIHKLDEKTNEVNSEYIDDSIQYDEDGVIVEEKPTTEDMQTLMTISQASGIDITKKAKELYGVSTLDDINMEQYNELKEIAING